MSKPKRSTALTLGDVLRSAAGALVPPQAVPPAPPPSGDAIDAQPDPSPTATTPPPQAAPQPKEHPMTATPAPAAPPTTAAPIQPTPAPKPGRPMKWLYNPVTDGVHGFEVLPDGTPEASFLLLREQRPDIIEVPEAFARAVLDGGPRPMLPPRAVPGLPAGLAQLNDLAGLSTIG